MCGDGTFVSTVADIQYQGIFNVAWKHLQYYGGYHGGREGDYEEALPVPWRMLSAV